MNRTEKIELAQQLQENFKKAQVAIMADYKGLGAADADELRAKLRETGATVKVLKNNIARVAAKENALGEEATALFEEMVGPTLVAWAFEDPAASAKVFHQFAEDFEALELKDGLMGDRRIKAAEVEQLAKLPSREVLLAQVLSAMNGPVSGFVRVLAGVPRSFLTVLAAIERKKAE